MCSDSAIGTDRFSRHCGSLRRSAAARLAIALVVPGLLCAQSVYVVPAPPSDGSTSGLRVPNGTVEHAYQRSLVLVDAPSLVLVPNGIKITRVGFVVTKGAGAAVTGTMTMYCSNTSSTSPNVITSWPDIIAGMTKVYNGPFTIPDSAGPIDLTLTSPFQYTGKTMYVAFEFQSTGPFTTQNAVFASNITRTSTVWTGFSSTALPNILNDVSDFRPVLRFGFPIPAVQWSAVAAGVQPNFIALDIADDLSAWAASPSGAVSLTNDGGKTWSHAPAVPDSVRFILGLSANSGLAISGAAAGPSRVYTAASSDSVWGRVTDPSLTIRIDAAGKTSSQSVWCLGAGAGDTLVLLNSNSGGKSWTRSVTGIVFEAGTKIASTSACRIGNAVWFGTEGTGGSSGRVYRSSTGPAGPWRYSATGRANVQAIAFSASGGTGIVSHAGCIDTIRRCVDGGVNWSPLVVPGLGEVRSLQYYSGGIDVWAATSTGIWRSSDDGLSWLRTFASTSGAQSLSVVRFFANYQSGLAVGSGGQILRGAWVINPASDVSDAPAQPSGFWLGANYPNPFNSSTWIEYSVPWLSRVSLKVIDLLGREVATLVAAEEGPGTFKVQWNGNRNASGVYFCRMAVRPLPGTASREYVRTERLILLK